MTIGSLFSGIGGLELGLERAGLGPVFWQAEIDPFCRRVLEKHWPNAQRYSDVREVDVHAERVEIICGGFPCQKLSGANVRNRNPSDALELWRELARIVGELRPRFVVVENNGERWRDWVPTVRSDLHRLGYPSVSFRLSTVDVGAPHDRDRVFVVADAHAQGESLRAINAEVASLSEAARRHRRVWGHAFAGPILLDDGLPEGVDATRAYGNAVCPIVAEVIGRAIVSASTRSDGEAA